MDVAARQAVFFLKFLTRFVHEMPGDDWKRWEDRLLSRDSPWTTKPISVDMLKQYLMQQITESRYRNFGDFMVTVGAPQMVDQQDFRLTCESQSAFFNLACDYTMATQFLANYVPVCG